jgi:hypothetical protein
VVPDAFPTAVGTASHVVSVVRAEDGTSHANVTLTKEVDAASPLLYQLRAGDEDPTSVWVAGPAPEPVEPIRVHGVGVVGGVKWTVIGVLVDLGML